MFRNDQVYHDGAFRTAHGRDEMELVDPTTEEKVGVLVLADADDVRAAVASAKRALDSYARSTVSERVDLLRALSDAVRARADDLTEATIREYGGPVAQARWRAGLAADNFLIAAEALKDFAFTRWIEDAEVVAQPVGVSAHIVPWNSVYNAISVKLAGALAAGCPVVVKPSEFSAQQNLLFTECLHQAGAPTGVINVVTGLGSVVGEALTSHPDVRKISFTGSNAVGASILAKSATRLPRVTLELGGKAPTIVMPDADLREAAATALAIAFTNNGQACIAGTRALVPRASYAAFCSAVEAAAADIIPGDPRDPRTTLGPLVNRRQWDRVQGYIHQGLAEGARLLVGGEGRPEGLARGFFVRPTVFADVAPDMAIAREEIFGPVLCVIPYDDEAHAVALANDTPFGLHAYVLGPDLERARAMADRLDVGRVAINGLVHEPRAPFGGFKASGVGREYGLAGLEDHLELKVVLGRPSPPRQPPT